MAAPQAIALEAPPPGTDAVSAPERTRQLVREHFNPVWRLLRRLGVPSDSLEDAAQEVFVVLARRVEAIAPGSEKSYLFGTALRVAKGIRRRNARERLRHEPLEDEYLRDLATPEAELERRRRLALLQELLGKLQDPERTVFVLFELEGLTLVEIARLLELPRGTVASRLRRARSRFVRALKARKR